jgi:urease accessory protein
MKFSSTLLSVGAAMLFWLVARPAFAHIGSGLGGGFFGGFSHPLLGPDHLLAIGLERLRSEWQSIASHAVASWIAAIGIMMLTFELARHRLPMQTH